MEAFKQVEHFVSARLAVIKTLFTLVQLEARLAALSVFPLLVNLCLLFIVLITLWLSTFVLVGYGTFLATHNIPLSLVVPFLINLLFLLGLTKYLLFNLKSMSFEKTRLYFSQNKSIDDEPCKKKTNSSNSPNGKNIATTANASDGE